MRLNLLLTCFSLLLTLISLAGCEQQTSAIATNTLTPVLLTPTTLPSPTVVPGTPITLQTIHMFDAKVGWAVTYNTNHILHTTTGVTHWQDVSPAFDIPTPILAGTDFFDPSTAWLAVTDANSPTLVVYHTHDGGQTWQKTRSPDQGLGDCQFTFINPQIGWMLVGKGAAAGSEAVDVLRTGDGGATWKIVSVTGFFGVNNSTTIPLGGDKSGISFVNTTTGWVTGSTAADHFALLYITHDGGVSWQHQSIPLPTNAFQVTTLPPVFFNATTGILPVILPGSQNQALNIYVTHNAGASWSTTTPVPTGPTAETVDFIDATHGWIIGNTYATASNQYESSTIYRTSDGGQRWTQHTIKLSADITLIDFVSQTQGWAIDSAQALYQTTDSGQTWTKVMLTS